MAWRSTKVFISVIAMQVLVQSTVVKCDLGSFLGAMAGSLVGKLITEPKTKDHYRYYPRTTVEWRGTLDNGCYRQVVKEPDIYNPEAFIETEQLLCPPNVQPPEGVPVQILPPRVTMPMPAATVMAPGANIQPNNVIAFPKTVGSYESSASSLLQTGSLLLIVVGIITRFL